jgi:hypothetical protein
LHQEQRCPLTTKKVFLCISRFLSQWSWDTLRTTDRRGSSEHSIERLPIIGYSHCPAKSFLPTKLTSLWGQVWLNQLHRIY